ncbi:hypothetical protein [Streptomyces sp. 840.1]|uniref:hypothetical protein n=1 Tax=Streptomyces sp. 840.1 TaxID=2485152 RepID=UPI0011CE7D08|nr:hypothetical protein [Streptomyces sp. 840.1]
MGPGGPRGRPGVQFAEAVRDLLVGADDEALLREHVAAERADRSGRIGGHRTGEQSGGAVPDGLSRSDAVGNVSRCSATKA